MTTTDRVAESPLFDSRRIARCTFDSCRAHWLKLSLAGVFFISTPHLVSAWLLYPTLHPPSWHVSQLWFTLVYRVADGAVVGVFQAWVTLTIVADVHGDSRDHRGVIVRQVGARALAVMGTGIVYAVCTALGLVLLIVPGVVLSIAWLVAVPCAAAEELGPRRAIGRSLTLTKGHRGDVFGLVAAWSIAALVINLAVVEVGSGWAPLKAAAQAPLVALVLSPMVGLVFGIIGAVGVACIYYELATLNGGGPRAVVADVFS